MRDRTAIYRRKSKVEFGLEIMQLIRAITGLFIGGMTIFIHLVPTKALAGSFNRFVCIQDKAGQFIIKSVMNDGKTLQDFATFKSKHFATSGFTPGRRCNLVEQRLNAAVESAISRGSEKTLGLITGKRNGYDVICTADSPGSKCRTLIITLTPEEETGVKPDQALQNFIKSYGNDNSTSIFKEGTDGAAFLRLYPFYSN
jgi:Circadian oscillating protein COP23